MTVREIKIPKRIKIGGYDYRIKINKVTDKELDCGKLWGQHRSSTREICLSMEAQPQQLSNTFIHEVFHAANEIYRNSKIEEDEIDALTQGIFQVLEQLGIRFTR